MVNIKGKKILQLTYLLYMGCCSNEVLAADQGNIRFDRLVRQASDTQPAVGRFIFQEAKGEAKGTVAKEIELKHIEDLGYFTSAIPAGGLAPLVEPYKLGNVIPPNVNLGQSKRRVRYVFDYQRAEHQIEAYEGLPKPNRGIFEHVHDQNQQKTFAKLVLHVTAEGGRQENVQFQNGQNIELTIDHERGAMGPVAMGGHSYGGGTDVAISNYRPVTYRNPVDGQPYTVNIAEGTRPSIPTHENRNVVYVQPFSLPGQRAAERDTDYLGVFESLGETLQPNERNSINDNPVIHVSSEIIGGTPTQVIHYVKATHEKWRKNGVWDVGFSIFSKKNGEKLKFNEGVTIEGDELKEGAYQLQSVKESKKANGTEEHVESWRMLGTDVITAIHTPVDVTAIPGFKSLGFVYNSAADKIADMQARLAETRKSVEDGIGAHRNKDRLFVIGKSQIGKTVFINALAGRKLKAYKAVRKYGGEVIKVEVLNPLANSRVGEGAGVHGTVAPTPYFLAEKNIVVWDCPGFEDPGGPAFDIVNSLNIRRAIKAEGKGDVKVKIGLAMEDSQFGSSGEDFLKYLNRITEMVPDIDALKSSLYLLITKSTHDLEYTRGRLGEFYEAQLPDAQGDYQDGLFPLTANALNLLEYFVKGAGNNRIVVFPEAKRPGEYKDIIAQDMWRRLDGVTGCVDPRVEHIKNTSPAVLNTINKLTSELNNNIKRFLNTQWYLDLMNNCRRMIVQHVGTVADLRTALNAKKTALKNLRDELPQLGDQLNDLTIPEGTLSATERDILQRWDDLSPINSIRRDIDGLKFLKRVKEDLTYTIDAWQTALTKAINSIDGLVDINGANGYDAATSTLTLKGVILGTSDIMTALAGDLTPRIINLYAANTLFIDGDLTKNGISVNFFAPFWKVTPGGIKTINLSGDAGTAGNSGNPGTDGAGIHGAAGSTVPTEGGDGQPGAPGKNGGSFFGKLFAHDNLDDLRIYANGGQGGSGGAGGRGGNGRNAGNGEEGSMSVVHDTGDVCIIPWGEHPHDPKPTPYFPHRLYFHVSDRQTHVGYLSAWIGPKFKDQIWVHGHVKQYKHAPEGEVGKNAGRRGQRGLGGNAGEIILVGADLVDAQKEQKQGAQGANDGAAGAVGTGGTNGMQLIGTRWTNCRIVGELSPNPTDRWHDGPRHIQAVAPRAANGTQPASLNPTAPTVPDDITQLTQAVQDNKVAEYRAYYQAKAENPLTSYLVRVFPGLF